MKITECKCTTECNTYSTILTDTAWTQINIECSRTKNETGGILIGYYDDNNTVVITEALGPPSDSTQGVDFFNRGNEGLQEKLNDLWLGPQRSYYIGEWHSHLSSHVYPSKTDIKQMNEISSDPRYQCKEPLLLLVGLAPNKDTERPCRMWVFSGNNLPIEFDRISYNKPYGIVRLFDNKEDREIALNTEKYCVHAYIDRGTFEIEYYNEVVPVCLKSVMRVFDEIVDARLEL